MSLPSESLSRLPIAVIGAGPVGLAAAARLLERGLTPLVLEKGAHAGVAMASWGHVRVFSPWGFNIDDAAHALLKETGWKAPKPSEHPTGAEIVERYLRPLAAHPKLAPHIRFNARVTQIARDAHDKMTGAGRADAPFLIRWTDLNGSEHDVLARAVIDASGTWSSPNPIGANGLSVPGERQAAALIDYGLPDVLDARMLYAGKRVLVIGGGHSAINVVLDLLRIKDETPSTEILWALRRNRIDRLVGGGINDQLPQRGALGTAALDVIRSGRVKLLSPFAVRSIARADRGLRISATLDGAGIEVNADRIIVAAGFRPQLDMLRELRIGLDPIVETTPALAPLIDPNLHSCGSVRPHGAAELAHPEPDFYIAGSKSYGRAPTFLMATGYEQVRSIAAKLAGDHEAARRVELVLPETGVCSLRPPPDADAPQERAGKASACCGAR